MTGPDVSTWDDLVATATVGTDTRRLELSELPAPLAASISRLDEAEPSIRLLAVGAVFTVAHRAGRLPTEPPDPMLPPAGPDDRPALTAGASHVLQTLGRRHPVLLADGLDAVAEAGYRLPAPVLSEYLAAGTRSADLRPHLEPVLGRRGRWLAAQNVSWRWVGAGASSRLEVGDDPELWRTGSPDQRRSWFAGARQADPAAARDLLSTGWATERPDDRAALLALFGPELSDADEPFLERALDDRRADVRDTARDLLTQLPGSALDARRAERAASAVRLEQRLLRRRLVVELPLVCDASMVRDGIAPAPPAGSGIGERHHWFREVVSAAPLECWPLPAADMLGLTVVDGSGADDTADFRWGLATAIVRRQNAEWARVLLASRTPPTDLTMVPGLITALPPAERFEMIGNWLARSPLTVLYLIMDGDSWPVSLGVEILRRLRQQQPVEQGSLLGAVSLIGRRLPAARTPELDAGNALYDLAGTYPADSRWRRSLTEAAETVMLRRRLLEEMS